MTVKEVFSLSQMFGEEGVMLILKSPEIVII